jgi:hypothetical protein
MAGTPTSKGEGCISEAPIEGMFDDYIATADKIGVKRKAELVAFGIKMKKLVGPERLKRIRPSMDVSPGQIKRVFCYRLPSLQQCRDAFEEALGQSIDWGEHDDG